MGGCVKRDVGKAEDDDKCTENAVDREKWKGVTAGAM